MRLEYAALAAVNGLNLTKRGLHSAARPDLQAVRNALEHASHNLNPRHRSAHQARSERERSDASTIGWLTLRAVCDAQIALGENDRDTALESTRKALRLSVAWLAASDAEAEAAESLTSR